MFHHDITYAMMRERVGDLQRQAAADRRAARASRLTRSSRRVKHARH